MLEVNQGFCVDPAAKRMRLSPLLLLALVFWISCAASFETAHGMDTAQLFLLGSYGAALAFGAAFCAMKIRVANIKLFAFAVSMLLVGVTCSFASAIGVEHACAQFGVNSKSESAQQELSFFVLNDAHENSYGVSVECLTKTPDGSIAKVRLYAKKGNQFFYGQCVTAQVAVSLPKESQESAYWLKGIAAKADVKSVDDVSWVTPFAQKRALFIQHMSERLGESSQTGLLLALACGYRGLLQEGSLYRDFQVAGLAHIVAVSGAHLSLAIAFVTVLFSRLHVKRRYQALLSVLLVVLFLFVCAFPISAFRAAFMSLLACLSFFARRRAASQNALALCIFTCLLVDPAISVSASFALSALSTLGIIVFVPFFTRAFGGTKQRTFSSKAKAFVKESVSLTLSASIATLPLSAALFAQVSLIAPLSNVLLGLLFTPLCISALACQVLFLAFGSLPGVILAVCQGLCRVFSSLVSILAAFPYAAIPAELSIAFALALSALLFIGIISLQRGALVHVISNLQVAQKTSPHRKLLFCSAFAAIVLIAIVVSAGRSGEIYLAALDVGQGDALLLRDGKTAMLVDTGNQDTQLKRELAKKGIRRLDAVFITHPDNDHCGSLPALLSVVQVEKGCVPAPMITCACEKCAGVRDAFRIAGVPLAGMEVGDSVCANHVSATMVWPYVYAQEGGNQDSLCLNVTVDVDGDSAIDYTALLVGDAERETLQCMIEQGNIGKTDIFKVGHHGSAVSCDQNALDVLSPRIALLSVGAYNRYGHPNPEVLSLLEANQVVSARTDEQGTITCFFEKDGIRVTTSG